MRRVFDDSFKKMAVELSYFNEYLYILVAIVAFSYIVYLFIRKGRNKNIWDDSMTFRGFIGTIVLFVFMIIKIISSLF
ncbi:hypothetical protein [Sphingobacterium anhuiense]|uniref:DUF4134 domain-containing protein n=1 Tax=Sphingobacterium anhuiense TaxID=493780 RepID=A0ABW5YVR4_9SPHI